MTFANTNATNLIPLGKIFCRWKNRGSFNSELHFRLHVATRPIVNHFEWLYSTCSIVVYLKVSILRRKGRVLPQGVRKVRMPSYEDVFQELFDISEVERVLPFWLSTHAVWRYRTTAADKSSSDSGCG